MKSNRTIMAFFVIVLFTGCVSVLFASEKHNLAANMLDHSEPAAFLVYDNTDMGLSAVDDQIRNVQENSYSKDKEEISLCEALDVDCAVFTFTTGGSALWFGQSNETYQEGDYAAQSGAISHNQLSWLETTVTGPGTLSFTWKVSSEKSFDWLNFFINGTRMNRISGEIDWHSQVYEIEEGEHTLRWSYTKDGSIDGGFDCGWVAHLEFISSYNTMKIHDAYAPPSLPGTETSTVTIELEIINEVEFVGFNADIVLPEGFDYVENSAKLIRFAVNEEEEEEILHFLAAGMLPGAHTLRLLSHSFPTTPYPGNNGVIVSFDLYTPVNGTGTYPLLIKNAAISDENMMNILTETINGTITLIDECEVTFIVGDKLKEPVSDATVYLHVGAGATIPETTDGDGVAVFNSIEPGIYQYTVKSDCYATFYGTATVTMAVFDVPVELARIPGDANDDESVNVSDIVVIISYYMGGNPSPFCFINADVNNDGIINIQDIVGITNIIFENKTLPHEGLKSENASIYLYADGIYIESDGTLTALQFELLGKNIEALSMISALSSHQIEYTDKGSETVAMFFSLSNIPIPEGKVRIIDFVLRDNELQWGDVLVANLNAESVPLKTYTDEVTEVVEPSGFESIMVYPNPAKDVIWIEQVKSSVIPVHVSLFNINGQLVRSLTITDSAATKTSMDIGQLPAGTYMLRLESDCSSATMKIMIE